MQVALTGCAGPRTVVPVRVIHDNGGETVKVATRHNGTRMDVPRSRLATLEPGAETYRRYRQGDNG